MWKFPTNWCYDFWWVWSSTPKVLKRASSSLQFATNSSLQFSTLQHLKNDEVRDEIDFLYADKHQSFLQVDFNTLDIKVSLMMGIIKHSQSLKVASLQYLYNISEKKLGMELNFWMQINIKASTSWHYRQRWKWPDIFKVTKIRNCLYFFNMIRKTFCNCFCVLLWWKTFRYFIVVQSCLLLLVDF